MVGVVKSRSRNVSSGSPGFNAGKSHATLLNICKAYWFTDDPVKERGRHKLSYGHQCKVELQTIRDQMSFGKTGQCYLGVT